MVAETHYTILRYIGHQLLMHKVKHKIGLLSLQYLANL